jgi:serine phosphatase RsbU (regulator of sigma subunit)
VRRAVHALASRASVAITNARVYEERATLAATLRAALVPPPLPRVPGLDVGARYRPAHATTEIGGDFFELVERPDGAWMFAIGDVCGKGVEAAVLTGQVRQSLRTADVAATDPAQLLRLVNDTMLTTDGSKFVTVVVGRVRTCPQGAHVRVGSGGHPPPLVLRRDGSVEETPVRGTIVGMLPEARFGAADVLLARGETLLLFTDGVTEARGDDGMLGTDRLRDLLADCGGMRAQAITERLEQLVLDFLDGRPHDDIALLALRAAEER